MTELLPCPFCGGEAHTYKTIAERYCAICNKPFCASVGPFDTEAEAIAAWNTRAERTCHETTIDKFFNGCDSCGYMWQFFYRIGKRERPNYCPNCGARVTKSDQYL